MNTNTNTNTDGKPGEFMKLEEAEELMGKTVDVLDNPDTCNFSGLVVDVKEYIADGVIVSVQDQEENVFDISVKYIEPVEDEQEQWCEQCAMEVEADEHENCINCGQPTNQELEKFECEGCGCYFMVTDRDDFVCPNCESKADIINEHIKEIIGTRWTKSTLQKHLREKLSLGSELYEIDESGCVRDFAFAMEVGERNGIIFIYFLKVPYASDEIYITETSVSFE